MIERSYPCDWYRVTRWTQKPLASTFVRETKRRLFWNDLGGVEYSQPKASRDGRWYPTFDRASKAITRRNAAAEARQLEQDRVRTARRVAAREKGLNRAALCRLAPQMLVALEEVTAAVDQYPAIRVSKERWAEILALIETAKEKAA